VELVTKADLAELRGELKEDITELRGEIKDIIGNKHTTCFIGLSKCRPTVRADV